MGIADIFIFSWWDSPTWWYFFLSAVPWTCVTIGILSILEKAIKRSDKFSSKTRKTGRLACTFMLIASIADLFFVMFFIAIPVGTEDTPLM